MTPEDTEQKAAQEAFSRGALDLPTDEQLKLMSFVELAARRAGYREDSAQVQVIDREIRKRLATDQAKINLPNMIWAAGVGGLLGICGAIGGVVIGYFLKTDLSVRNAVPPTSMSAPNARESAAPAPRLEKK